MEICGVNIDFEKQDGYFINADCDENYYNKAKQRLDDAMAQTNIFQFL